LYFSNQIKSNVDLYSVIRCRRIRGTEVLLQSCRL